MDHIINRLGHPGGHLRVKREMYSIHCMPKCIPYASKLSVEKTELIKVPEDNMGKVTSILRRGKVFLR